MCCVYNCWVALLKRPVGGCQRWLLPRVAAPLGLRAGVALRLACVCMRPPAPPLLACTPRPTAARSIKPYTPTERKARAATRNQPWGPTGTELAQLADMTYNPQDCATILNVVALRLAYPPHKWRNVYKALTLIEYLVRQGSEACVAQARGVLNPQLQALASSFNHVGPDGRDMGTNVRHRWAGTGACSGRQRREGGGGGQSGGWVPGNAPSMVPCAFGLFIESLVGRPAHAGASDAPAAPPLLPAPAARECKHGHRRLHACRAQAILALLHDEARLAAERAAHQKKRGAYQGFSNYEMTVQGAGGSVAPQGDFENRWQSVAQVGACIVCGTRN